MIEEIVTDSLFSNIPNTTDFNLVAIKIARLVWRNYQCFVCHKFANTNAVECLSCHEVSCGTCARKGKGLREFLESDIECFNSECKGTSIVELNKRDKALVDIGNHLIDNIEKDRRLWTEEQKSRHVLPQLTAKHNNSGSFD